MENRKSFYKAIGQIVKSLNPLMAGPFCSKDPYAHWIPMASMQLAQSLWDDWDWSQSGLSSGWHWTHSGHLENFIESWGWTSRCTHAPHPKLHSSAYKVTILLEGHQALFLCEGFSKPSTEDINRWPSLATAFLILFLWNKIWISKPGCELTFRIEWSSNYHAHLRRNFKQKDTWPEGGGTKQI